MSDAAYVVQKVEWYQLRAQDGTAFFVMVSTLPNGFVTAVPCDLTMVRAEHHLMALARQEGFRLCNAYIRKDNIASLNGFLGLGFQIQKLLVGYNLGGFSWRTL